MSDEFKDFICLFLFVSIGCGIMTLFFLSIKDSEKPAKEIEVHNVPIIHSNGDGTIDTYLFPIVD